MATSADLMGLGVPGAVADRISNTVLAVTTTGTISTTAATLKGGHTYVLTTAASQTGGILSGTESIGDIVHINNPTATSAVIYPPAGCTFNTAASTSFTIAQYKTGVTVRLTATTYAAYIGA